MTELHDLRPTPGSRRKRVRKARGPGSGKGKTAGRGHDGQKSRAGESIRPGFEGGQMPLQRRIPKRGFTPPNRTRYYVVNVKELDGLGISEVDPDSLRKFGVIGKRKRPVKVLGAGEISTSLQVRAHAFSVSAREKIEAAGGSAVVLDPVGGSSEGAEGSEQT